MNLWKKVLASVHLVTLVMVGGSCLLAGERGAPCALYAYLDGAWLPASDAARQEKTEVLSDLRFCVESGQKVYELDLTGMSSDRSINLDSVQHLKGLRVLRCPRWTTLVLPPKLPEHVEKLYFTNSRLLTFPMEILEEHFLYSKNLRVLDLSGWVHPWQAERAMFISPTVEELDLSGNDLSTFFKSKKDTLGREEAAPGLLVVDEEGRAAVASSFSELRARYGEKFLEQIAQPLRLKRLVLRNCQLAGELTGLPDSLEELDLEGSDFFGAGAIERLVAGLPRLRVLYLDCYTIAALCPHALSDRARAVIAAGVWQLVAIGRDLQSDARLWAWVAYASGLEDLTFQNSGIKALPVGLPGSLRKLNLKYNGLGRVNAQAWVALFAQVPRLRELDLAGCLLAALPGGLPGSLRKLDLRSNDFRQVDAQAWAALFAQVPNLEELALADCNLRALPAGLPAGLRKLSLWGNNFEQVDAQAWAALFVQRPNLEELGLGRCHLTELPAWLPGSLKKLRLSNNNFAQVGAEAWIGLFAQVPNLEELDLESSRLTQLPAGLPGSLKKLRISCNNFAQVGVKAWIELFAQAPNLEELHLVYCNLMGRPAGSPARLTVYI